MSKFQILWNYTRKKNGEIVIAEEELQKMLDMAEKTAYNEGIMDGLKIHTDSSMPSWKLSSHRHRYISRGRCQHAQHGR